MLTQIISASNPDQRNQSLDSVCFNASLNQLLQECDQLESFRQANSNLYNRVRALFFLYAIHRFHLPRFFSSSLTGQIPFSGYQQLLKRRFEEAIAIFLAAQKTTGPNDAISSALSAAYHGLAFQTLSDQVRQSVRSVRGNQWMFRIGHPIDQPLRIRPELLERSPDGSFPILRECTPVRMDLSHSAWSDIFFLGMDFPEGARVLNVSIDLSVKGRDTSPKPPIETYFRIIDEPVLRLTSVDLAATVDLSELSDVFDFGKDYLGLLKAAVIASGIIPPGVEGSSQSLVELLARMISPGHGIELVTSVNNIPKGSRLAVSTNLLGSIVAVCMRATGQAKSLVGSLQEEERRIVAARAILGEWLGGSGGGWQDSGGIWPGLKLITGALAADGDPEFGISRGRLLPNHHILSSDQAPESARQHLQDSLVLVHGGMAQNVGPILEMVTEKYLLRSEPEWLGRKQAVAILDQILEALRTDKIPQIGDATTRNFFGPLQTIIPWASNFYTESLIESVRSQFASHFWGFWMLGGMSGGGMGFIFSPHQKAIAQQFLQQTMSQLKSELQHALPFAMEPVVYDFSINNTGTSASVLRGDDALFPQGYYTLVVPRLLRMETRSLSPLRRAELDKFGAACRVRPELRDMVRVLFDQLLPQNQQNTSAHRSLNQWLEQYGFDRTQHEQIRDDLRNGRIGLAQNRLPTSSSIRDVEPGDVIDATSQLPADTVQLGQKALAAGQVAVLSLAGGAGSRWTQGAGTVKALHPFCKLAGRHRTFLEVHLAKSRKTIEHSKAPVPHLFSTSYLTHAPTEELLKRQNNYLYPSSVLLSPGRSVGLRLIPMVRDLRFAWEETPQQLLDEQKQKMRSSVHAALIDWARQTGEGTDYTDNMPLQCLHPVGHWFEVPNLLRNGVLHSLLQNQPNLKYIFLHNIDTLGAHLDPGLLGSHIQSRACLSFEVIRRRIEDRGGGLARVDGRIRLVEGLALPHEESEFALSYYNTMSTWIDLDSLLSVFGLQRADLGDTERVAQAVRSLASRMPTYITLKDVKKRWGHAQEDIFPVAQFEKLWGDMTALPDIQCQFLAVSRRRGQQLKDQAQLDSWLRDGSAAYLESLCQFH